MEALSMNPPNLKDIVKAGLTRYFHDGSGKFSKQGMQGLIRPRNIPNSLDDPEIQRMLKELEAEKFIKLYYEEDRYLEITGVAPLNWDEP
jgi:hypothetical protein